jgi:pyruvate dehydrogenase E2 component (dihydrolipoamide acetyltransferase)
MTLVFDQPVAFSRMRKAVVRTVTASASVPQYSLAVDVAVAPILRAKEAARDSAPRASVSDVIHSAVVRSLAEHRNVNASFTEQGTVLHSSVNLAFIVEVADGMVAPAIIDADHLDIAGLATERVRLTEAALAGALTPEELLNGTFTVSNLGTLGIHRFNAMVLPPQAAILAIGSPTPGAELTLTLSCDHRVIDGAPAARFLRQVADLLSEEGSS